MKIEDLFQEAKDRILKEGKHPPVMYIEWCESGKQHLDIYPFASFGAETADKEHRQMFSFGSQFGKQHPGAEISQLSLIIEVWASELIPGEAPTWKRPAEDPQRHEYLTVQVVDLIDHGSKQKPDIEQSLHRAEILRPASGVVDLRPDNAPIVIVNLLLPAYFLAGFAYYAKLTDEQRAALVRQGREDEEASGS
jgi:hypothetical protein